MAIILRTVKGSELTFAEVDGNFQSLFYSSSLDGTNLILHTTGSTSQSVDLSSISGGDTGSLMVTGSILNGTLTFTKGDSSTFDLVYNTGSFTGSFVGDGSGLTGIAADTSTTSSYALTASYVENAQTASYVENAQTASYVTTAQTASYVENAQTASYVTTAQTASYVETSQTASYVANALTTASAEFAEITFTKGDGSTFQIKTTPRQVIETVKNLESGTLVKGTPVYASGSTGNAVHVYAASASLSSRMPAAYILNQDLTSGQEGEGLLIGFINGVDTSAFTSGDVVYVAADGGYTNIKPTGSNLIQNLGKVTKSDINGSGVISGAGRSNDVPNILEGYVWIGDSNGVATPAATSSIQNVVSSSYALTASYVENAQTASYVTTAQTASFVTTAQTASYIAGANVDGTVTSASYALSSSHAQSGGDVSISSTPANNQIAVWTSADTIEGDSNLTWTGAQIEVTDPDNNLTEVRADWLRVYNETDDANLFLYGYGTGHKGEIVIGAANGDRTTPTKTLNGNTISNISSFGHSGTGFRKGGQLLFLATEDYTEGSNYGTRFSLQTVADGSTTLVTRYTTDGDGNHTFIGDVTISGDITGSSFTGSFVGDGSGLTGLVSSSYALTASYVETAQTASFVSLVAGPNVTINQAGTSFEISGSAGGSSLWTDDSDGKISYSAANSGVQIYETGNSNTYGAAVTIERGFLMVGDSNTIGHSVTSTFVRRSVVFGGTNILGSEGDAAYNIISGNGNDILSGDYNGTIGQNNIIKGDRNFSAGQTNLIYGDDNISLGKTNTIGTTSANVNKSVAIGEDVFVKANDQIVIGFGIDTNASYASAKGIYVGIENTRPNSGWFTDPNINTTANFAIGGRDTMRSDVGIIKAGAGAGMFYLVNYNNANITEPTVDLAGGVAMWAKDGPTGVAGLTVKDDSGGKSWIGGKIGANQVTPTATIHATGEGTTSGTTSLLVEDSNNDTLFEVKDDGTIHGVSGAILAITELTAAALVTHTAAVSTTATVINLNSDATTRLAKASFVAPPSGNVLVRIEFDATLTNSSTNLRIGLHNANASTTTPTEGWFRVNGDQDGSSASYFAEFKITGLTPGTTYDRYFVASSDFSGVTIRASQQQTGAIAASDLPSPLRIKTYDLGAISITSNPTS